MLRSLAANPDTIQTIRLSSAEALARLGDTSTETIEVPGGVSGVRR